MKKITIGLFGTCGNSTWRNKFMEEYNKRNIDYFNPLKDDWKPEDAIIEADHLADDGIVLFPVTNETYAFGSLGEVGFSIMQALKLDETRDIVVMIENDVKVDKTKMTSAELSVVDAQTKDSLKMRALIMAHLKKVNYPNVYIVKNLEDMLSLSLELHNIQLLKNSAKEKYSV